MIYSLDLKHTMEGRTDGIYIQNEIRKAKETLNELYKDKDKYKDKIKVLSQHIHILRDNYNIKEYYEGTLTRKRALSKPWRFTAESRQDVHEQLIAAKEQINRDLKIRRKRSREREVWHKTFGIKKYQMIGREDKGYTHTKPGTILELLKSRKIMTIETAKKPSSHENHVGVEIEFASFLKNDEIGQLFFDAGLIQYVQLQHEYVTDRDPNESEYEICIIAPESQIFDIIERVCIVLNEQMDVNITKGCGLHIHLDARNRDIKQMFNNLFNCQEILYDMVAFTRRNNKHVRILTEKIWFPFKNGVKHTKECKDHTCICAYRKDDAERYYGLNTWSYKSLGTMEVRIHSGTSNANKINNWIRLLLNIIETKKIPTYVHELNEMTNYVKLDDKLLKYVENRIVNFQRKDLD